MFVAIGLIVLGILLGLACAVYNLNDHEGRARRLEERRKFRQNRRTLWDGLKGAKVDSEQNEKQEPPRD